MFDFTLPYFMHIFCMCFEVDKVLVLKLKLVCRALLLKIDNY